MATGAGESVFIDTNVLVYAGVEEAPHHEAALDRISGYERTDVPLWISRQVIREYLAVLSRPQTFSLPVPGAILVGQVRNFMERFHVADDDGSVTDRLLTLLEARKVAGKRVHDANIVATMQSAGIRNLLTHNVDDFTGLDGTITVIPLIGT